MDLRTYLAIIRKYLALIVAAGLLGLLAGYLAYATQPKQYAADVQFYVSTPVGEQGSAQSAGQFATNRMVSYSELLRSQELGERVVKATGVNLTGAQVAQEIAADTTVESVLVKATVTAPAPQRALQIAQGVQKVFGPMVDQLDNAGRKVPVVQINTVSAPQLHKGPVAPKVKTTLLMGLGAGLLLAMAYALLRELLDNSVKNEGELRDVAGAPVIGSVPNDRQTSSAPLVLSQDGDRAEAHRKLRTNLNFLGATEQAKVVAFTAPADGDGCSTVAANTALSFAETGERVCLVGADLRTPGGLEFTGARKGPGLSAVLAGTAALDEAVQHRRGEPALDLLDAGDLPPNPAALLGSDRFARTIQQLRDRYDRVVVDTPALLPTADAALVAGVADGVVLVVRDGSTTANQVERSRAALDAIGARLLGVVNNRARRVGEGARRGGGLRLGRR